MTVTKPRLGPQHWHLLARIYLREAPISDVRAWMYASDAERDHVLELEAAGLIVASATGAAGTELKLAAVFPLDQPPAYGAFQVDLTASGRTAARKIVAQMTALRLIAEAPGGRMPLRKALTAARVDLDVLTVLDEARLIDAMTSENGGRQPVPLAQATADDRMFGVQVRITEAGRRYVP